MKFEQRWGRHEGVRPAGLGTRGPDSVLSVPFLLHRQRHPSLLQIPTVQVPFQKPLFPRSLSWSPPHFTPYTHKSVGSLLFFTPSWNIYWISLLPQAFHRALNWVYSNKQRNIVPVPLELTVCSHLSPWIWVTTIYSIRKTLSVPSDKFLLCLPWPLDCQ